MTISAVAVGVGVYAFGAFGEMTDVVTQIVKNQPEFGIIHNVKWEKVPSDGKSARRGMKRTNDGDSVVLKNDRLLCGF